MPTGSTSRGLLKRERVQGRVSRVQGQTQAIPHRRVHTDAVACVSTWPLSFPPRAWEKRPHYVQFTSLETDRNSLQTRLPAPGGNDQLHIILNSALEPLGTVQGQGPELCRNCSVHFFSGVWT